MPVPIDRSGQADDRVLMRRRSPTHLALRSAFARSSEGPTGAGNGKPVTLRIRGSWLALVVGLPGLIGAFAILAALSRSGADDGAFGFGVALSVVAGCLLVLGFRSFLVVRPEGVSVRFFGIRPTTVRFDQLTSATFGMAFPSISYAITLRDANGRKALAHSNWWNGEHEAVRLICRAILDLEVPVDRSTARTIAMVLRVKRPTATIAHHGVIRRDRIW